MFRLLSGGWQHLGFANDMVEIGDVWMSPRQLAAGHFHSTFKIS
jgi:hypothetical protein